MASYEAYKTKYNRRKTIEDWIYKPNSSSDFSAVYGKGNKRIIAFKGTSLKHLSQIIADFKILFDGISNSDTKFTGKSGYVKDREQELKRLIDEVGKSNIKTTGHSLGGTTSVILSLEHGLKGSGFNIGSADINYNKYKKIVGDKKFYTYYIKGDVLTKSWVSNGSLYRKNNITKSIKQKCSNAHGINNFVPIKYLDDADCK